jgi:tetratricopeptide (TPR) repeat protein
MCSCWSKTRAFLSCLACVAGVLLLARSQSRAAAAEAGLRDKPNTEVWRQKSEAGEKAMAERHLAEAGPLLEAALAEAEKFGPKDDRLAQSLTDLGRFRNLTNDFVGAQEVLRRALDLRRGDPDRLLEADCLMELGYACDGLGNVQEAEKDLLEARDIVDRKEGPEHPLGAICAFNLAKVYEDENEYGKSEPLMKQALETALHPLPKVTREQRLDPARYTMSRLLYDYKPNYNLAFEILHHLAVMYIRQDRPDKAQSCYEERLKVAEEGGGSDAVQQGALVDLGRFYASRTNYPKAEGAFERLEHAQEKSSGLKDPATLKTLATLVTLYEREAKASDAESALKRALETRAKYEDPESEDILNANGDLGACYVRHGNYKEAAVLYERLWALADKVRTDDVRELPMLSQLAIVYAKLGRDAGLELVYQQQINIYEKTFGPNHKAVLKPLEDYAQLLRKLKREEQAESLEARAKTIRAAQAL